MSTALGLSELDHSSGLGSADSCFPVPEKSPAYDLAGANQLGHCMPQTIMTLLDDRYAHIRKLGSWEE